MATPKTTMFYIIEKPENIWKTIWIISHPLMNGSGLSNFKISKTLRLPGAQENLDFLLGFIKSYAGTFTQKTQSHMFFQAGSRKAKPETPIYATYTDFCKDFETPKNSITSGKHDLHRAKYELLNKCSSFLEAASL